MKIFISADLEGINGIVAPEDVEEAGSGYEQAKVFMTEEVNAVARGAFAGGATEVVVCDSHNVSANIRVDMLEDNIRIIRGDTRSDSMMHSVDESYDGVILLGYHAKFGTQNAVLDHTFSPQMIRDLRVNGVSVGEFGFNTLFAAYKNVPVILVTGDQALDKEVKVFKEDIDTVIVKHAKGRFCADCLPREKTQKMLEEASEKAVRNIDKATLVSLPEEYNMEVTFQQVNLADGAMRVPGTKRLDSMTVAASAADMGELMDLRQVVFNAASGFYNPMF